MWGLLAGIAAKGYNLWQQKKAQDASMDDYNRQVRVNKALAAEQLAITYNSILAKSLEVTAAARRQEFQIRQQARQAEGSIAVQAANTGAGGRRAELARKMAVVQGTESAMTSLELDTRRSQDDLIRRADMEERATINRLISDMPDIPRDSSSSNTLEFVGGVLDSFDTYRKQKQEKLNLTVMGGASAYTQDGLRIG